MVSNESTQPQKNIMVAWNIWRAQLLTKIILIQGHYVFPRLKSTLQMSFGTGWRYEIAISQLAMHLSLFRKNRNSLPFGSTWLHLQFLMSVQVSKSFSVLCFVVCLSSFCVLCPMLQLSLDCPFVIVPFGFLCRRLSTLLMCSMIQPVSWYYFYFFNLNIGLQFVLLLLGVNLELHKIYASTFSKKKRKIIKTYT